MPSITNEQLKGNFAENLAAEWLSRVCLVRPVTAGTDIGLDLYCESIVEKNPYLHFWVQVKTIGEKDITIKDGAEVASFRFTRSHLEYWSRQPIPVYAFLVPVIGWPPIYPTRIFSLPITRHIIKNGLPDTETIRLETSDCTGFSSLDKDWHQFITEIVPADSAILLLSKGLVTNIEFLGSEQKHYAKGFALKYSNAILDKIRDAVVILGYDALERENDDFKGVRWLCEAVASLFTININELGVNFLVESALKDGDTQKAIVYIESIKNKVASRLDIDEITKTEYISKLEALHYKIKG